jgi:hypothetical protein
MAVTRNRRTPGVYVTELDAFPPSIVGVQTAVPAFIGYTEKAEVGGKPVFGKPVKIGSLADYEQIFGGQFKTLYDLAEVPAAQLAADPDGSDFKAYDPSEGKMRFYALAPAASQFYLFASLRLFYANGGGSCYVVSVGTYEEGATIDKEALLEGLDAIGEQVGPTLLVVPDATLLPANAAGKSWESLNFRQVVQAMLAQCGKLQDRVAILDVYGSLEATSSNLDAVIARFREDVGSAYLSYGMSYFPFLATTVFSIAEVDFTHLNLADAAQLALLQEILGWENLRLYGDPATASKLNPRGDAIQADIGAFSANNTADEVRRINANLTAALPVLVYIENLIADRKNLLPPCGAMAGIFTQVDATRGVWNAPANVSLSSVVAPTFKLNDQQQEGLNVPLDGKAVDAIREFTGRGTVVWGARTLDGNSNDYRYIQVRRTLIYIEQSIKAALDPFVFAANDGKTWATVVSMVSGFLTGLWSQGGLMGATASEAYSVECGLGSTMTAQDILDGYMIVQVTLQMIRPAEFIELTFRQRMEGA